MKIKKITLLTIIFFMICVSFISYKKINAFNVDEQVEKIVHSMTLEEKIGQMIMLDFRQWRIEGGKKESLISLNTEISEIIRNYNLGGIILFSENISNINQTVELVHDIQQIALESENKNLPMLIALDQEGGMVSRLREGTNLPGNMAIGATRSKEAAYNSGNIIGKELQSLGINVNFAPVLDINNNPNNPVIGIRSISSNADLVGELGCEIIKGMQVQDIVATAKHFPGHGDTFIDTHYGLPVVKKSLEELKNIELKPFKNAINHGVDMIMTAHIQFPEIEKGVFTSKLDGSEIYLPATLSKNIITDILRKEMHFKGVVITDAMNMKAISDHFGEVDACKLAINAGVDIVLMPTILRGKNDVLKLDKIFKGIVDAVKNKEIEEEKINDSVSKIINLKIKRGIIGENNNLSLQEKQYNAKKVIGCKEHKDLERKISEEAITVMKNENNILPLNPKKGENILLISITKQQIESMKFGIDRLVKEEKINKPIISSYEYDKTSNLDEELKSKIEAAQYIIMTSQMNGSLNLKNDLWRRCFPKEVIKLSNKLKKPLILVSIKNPYDVALYDDAKVEVLTYGFKGMDPTEYEDNKAFSPNIPASMSIIFGAVSPKGRLPVNIPNIDENGLLIIGNDCYLYGEGLTELDY